MTAPHPDDPLHDDWRDQQDQDAGFAVEEKVRRLVNDQINAREGDVTAKELDEIEQEARDQVLSAQPWEITDDAGANWALRKIARAEAEVDRVKALAADEINRISAWAVDTIRGPQDDIGFFRTHLIHYRRQLEERDPSLPKTYKLPAGDLTRRKGPTRIEVTDEAAFVAWAEENDPSLLARKPLVSRLKDQKDRYQPLPADGDEGTERATGIVTTDGEVVPGVHQVTAVEQYSVKAR